MPLNRLDFDLYIIIILYLIYFLLQKLIYFKPQQGILYYKEINNRFRMF